MNNFNSQFAIIKIRYKKITFSFKLCKIQEKGYLAIHKVCNGFICAHAYFKLLYTTEIWKRKFWVIITKTKLVPKIEVSLSFLFLNFLLLFLVKINMPLFYLLRTFYHDLFNLISISISISSFLSIYISICRYGLYWYFYYH